MAQSNASCYLLPYASVGGLPMWNATPSFTTGDDRETAGFWISLFIRNIKMRVGAVICFVLAGVSTFAAISNVIGGLVTLATLLA